MYTISEWARVFEALHREQMNHFWTPPPHTKFLTDIEQWMSPHLIPSNVKRTIKTILTIFTHMELEVIDNIEDVVDKMVNERIVSIMMTMQEAMEGIHTLSYNTIDNALRYDDIHDGILEARVDLLRWRNTPLTLPEALIHLTFSEGILFNNLFPIFFLLEKKGLLPQSCTINKEVLSDENLHTKSSYTLYNVLSREGIISRLPSDRVYDICEKYVAVDDMTSSILYQDEDPFYAPMTPSNSRLYTRIVANTILRVLGYNHLYPDTPNPYTFMDQSLLNTLEFFFDKEVVSYGLDDDNPYVEESDDE
jgi:ribonucleotide reductase beta subunit family protein with ferritin-like domain